MPSPETKAAASARLNLSAMRCASQPSTSKAESSSSRCDAFGSAESSCSGIEMRSTCGVPVSVRRRGLGRPAGADVGVVDQHVEGARLHGHHVGDGPDRGRRAQHADDLGRGLRIDQVAAVGGHRGRQRLLLDGQAAQPVVVARAQIGGEGLLVRLLGLGGAGQRRAGQGDGFAVEHGQTGFLFLELRFDLGLKGVEFAQEPGQGSLDLHVRVPAQRDSARLGLVFSVLHQCLSLTT